MSDVIYIASIAFILAILVLIMGYVVPQVINPINATMWNLSNQNTNISTLFGYGLSFQKQFDYFVAMAILGMIIASVVFAFMIRTHPIFFILSFFICFVMIFISIYWRDFFVNTILNIDIIASVKNDYPITVAIVSNLPILVLVINILIAIATYVKGEPS